MTRQRLPKSALARFTFNHEANLLYFDASGKAEGRGANLILDLDAFDKAVKIGGFSRALKANVTEQNALSARESFAKYLAREQLKNADGKVAHRVSNGTVKLD